MQARGYPGDAPLCGFRLGRLRSLLEWKVRWLAVTIRARWVSSTPGSLTMRRACATWLGCVGRVGSSASSAGASGRGG